MLSAVVLAALLFLSQEAFAQWSQQAKLPFGSGAAGRPQQGSSVALSLNGDTAIVGGPADNGFAGAAWVFTRNPSSGVWTQQGPKLVGTGAIGTATQGTSVALSSDGNTAIVGGPGDSQRMGAAWIFTRDASGRWAQQGDKLVGTGARSGTIFQPQQGFSVSLSSDNTAIVGGVEDSDGVGAAWIYTRSLAGVWTQFGPKLVGTGAAGAANQGQSVALSSDGTTAILGGPNDNEGTGGNGAAWIFTPGVDRWNQQGDKLIAPGTARLGRAVALSADGNTAIVGGPNDNAGAGAAWFFTRSSGVWSRQPGKLVGVQAIGGSQHGSSVSLSSNANTAIVGGRNANESVGAAWIYTVSTRQGVKLVGTGSIGVANQGHSVALSLNGNTAIVGGPGDNQNAGAAWVFVLPTAPPPPPPVTHCTWAERTYSHGAKFCMGPTAALTCDNGKWIAATYASCNTASPIDAK